MNYARKLISAARSGGKIIKDYFWSKEIEIHEKDSPDNLVTNIDCLVQDKVCKILKRYFTEAIVISEEGYNHEAENQTIYIDPLDGTLNFVHGYDQLAISIGLWNNNVAVAGVVFNPITENMYYAVKGQGAFWNGKNIHPSVNTSLSQCLVATGWPYDRQISEQVVETVSKFWSQCQEVRISGSAALNICHVASGVFDGYWEADLSPWDYAEVRLLR